MNNLCHAYTFEANYYFSVFDVHLNLDLSTK